MGFQSDSADVDRLAAEIAQMTGEDEASAVLRALEERRDRLRKQQVEAKAARIRKGLEERVWPLVPPEALGRAVTKAEREEILGYGTDGV